MATRPGPLLTVRAAVVLLLALLVGIAAGVLGYFVNGGLAAAALLGGGAVGAALALFDKLIGQ